MRIRIDQLISTPGLSPDPMESLTLEDRSTVEAADSSSASREKRYGYRESRPLTPECSRSSDGASDSDNSSSRSAKRNCAQARLYVDHRQSRVTSHASHRSAAHDHRGANTPQSPPYHHPALAQATPLPPIKAVSRSEIVKLLQCAD